MTSRGVTRSVYSRDGYSRGFSGERASRVTSVLIDLIKSRACPLRSNTRARAGIHLQTRRTLHGRPELPKEENAKYFAAFCHRHRTSCS